MAGMGEEDGTNGQPGHRDADASPGEPEPLLIPAGEVARMLGISSRTLWRLVSAGRMPAPVRLKGSTRWPRDQIRSWVALGCPRPGSRGDDPG